MSTLQAKDIIFDQISTELFLGHNAIGVYMALSEHSAKLTSSPYRQAFGIIQRHALDAFILSVCKLYEKPNQRYPNYSIPTTLELIKKDIPNLSLENLDIVKLVKFIQQKIDSNFAICQKDDISRIPTLIRDYFSLHCPQTPPRAGYELDGILDALKVLRDKRVAHHENTDISSMNTTDLNGALQLLAFGKTYINIVGYGFFGFSTNGIVSTDKFEPQKSVIWSELNLMIKVLEQADSADG
ncbi:MAG: hypothetical protein JRJ01_08040 [Deltaproteobacteria bacterium]|nr:hypothetical protein [Deltaproteobacteria bacterium]